MTDSITTYDTDLYFYNDVVDLIPEDVIIIPYGGKRTTKKEAVVATISLVEAVEELNTFKLLKDEKPIPYFRGQIHVMHGLKKVVYSY